MDANLNELVAALSETNSGDAQEQIRELMADLARRPVPVNSLHRLWISGELSAEIALAYFALWIRKGFADAETRNQQVMETNLRVALKLLHRLAYMRGAMTKIGQAAANFPNIVPSEIADTLEQLHFDAPAMHFSLVQEMFLNELGKVPEDLFATFDREAFAAASFGQVHRARLKSGEEVAVKIQYPGVARTIDADFRNLGALLFPMRLGKDWDTMQASFGEIHRMLKQEVDYEREAESLREATGLFQASDGIVVPRVYPEFSTARVLTMDFIRGAHLPQFLEKNPSQELRDEFGRKMYLAWKRIDDAHINYADPSPGNYVFMDDGRLGLLDFGCVRYYDAEERKLMRLSLPVPDNIEEFPAYLRRAAGSGDDELADPEYIRSLWAWAQWTIAPLVVNGKFDFGEPAHLKEGVERLGDLVRRRYTRSHPMYVYFLRSLFGLRAVLYRLRARVDVRTIFLGESGL